jgi:hypothetical protein
MTRTHQPEQAVSRPDNMRTVTALAVRHTALFFRTVRGVSPGTPQIRTRADARRFRQLVVSDAARGRPAALFAQGLQTRGPLELDLGDRIGSL